ncbi:putative reactive intermediate deaminase TdcF [compost metagenome]
MEQVIKTTVWLSDLSHFERFNQVYRSYFQAGAYPVRSTVQAQLAFGVGLEIEAQAYSPAA